MTPLADEFYQLAHDNITGQPRLSERLLGMGMSAAVLAEMIFGFALTVSPDGTVRLTDQAEIGDEIWRTVRAMARREQRWHPVGTWLACLGQAGVVGWVGHRLLRSGQIGADGQPTSWSGFNRPATRLRARLSPTSGESLAWSDITLAGLALACDLGSHVTWDDESRRQLAHLLTLLASLSPPLHAVVGETRAAVGRSVLVQRT